MERDFTKDLTIMVAGTGKITAATLREQLDDWVFGNVDSREVKLVIPIMNRPTPGMRFMVDWAIQVEADVQVVQTLGAGMTRELAALDDIIKMDTEQETLDECFKIMLERHKAGDEVAFLMTYDKTSVYTQGDHNMSDLEILCEAKNYTWLPTLNAEVMADAFEGYESTDERIKREAAEKAFAEKIAEEKAATKPAKKAAAPRKKAAPKQESTSVVNEPEKATEGLDKLIKNAVQKDKSHIHQFVWADDENGHDGSVCMICGMDEDRYRDETSQTTLKADVVLAPRVMPKSMGMAKGTRPDLSTLTPDEIWADVAKARPAAVESNRNELVIQLGENIAQMGEVFSKTIRTYAALVEEIRNDS